MTRPKKGKSPHPRRHELYTPITPEIIATVEKMREVHGTWGMVSWISGTKLKVVRRIRRPTEDQYCVAISQKLLDRLCSTTGVGSIHDYPWYTPDQMEEIGAWKPFSPNAGQDAAS